MLDRLRSFAIHSLRDGRPFPPTTLSLDGGSPSQTTQEERDTVFQTIRSEGIQLNIVYVAIKQSLLAVQPHSRGRCAQTARLLFPLL
jgi:hypothetical protein